MGMRGKIDVSNLNVVPEKHEFAVAKFVADLGKDVAFLKPSQIPNTHTPDILMDGLEWEIKSPQGSSKRTIEANFRAAVKQSHYLIFDLRRIKIPEKQCLVQLEREFSMRQYVKRLLVIRKNGDLLEYPPKR